MFVKNPAVKDDMARTEQVDDYLVRAAQPGLCCSCALRIWELRHGLCCGVCRTAR